MGNHDKITKALMALLVALLMVISACEGYQLNRIYTRSDETNRVVRVLANNEQRRAASGALKLKAFYMEQDERVWGDLAEYAASATIIAAKKHNLELPLLVGVVASESGGYPFAKSRSRAKGMGQVDFKAHADRFPAIKEECDKYDPVTNLDCAAELLSECVSKYGIKLGLQVYNLGETAFKAGKRNPAYVAKVLKNVNKYRRY